MKFRYFLFASLLMFASFAKSNESVALDGAEVGKWTMDFDAAAKLSAEKGLPMLLNFTGSDWCGWCKLMDKNVFAGEAWKAYAADNVVLVTLDFPKDPSIVPEKFKERNTELQSKFGVRGYPTYIVLDSDGETVLGQLGAGQDKTPESFIEEFKDTTRLSAANIKAYSEANPDKAEAFKEAIQSMKAVESEFKEWIASRPEKSADNDKKFEDFKARYQKAAENLETFK